MLSLPGLTPSPWCPGPRGRLAGGWGEPSTAHQPDQGRDLGTLPPHTCPHPREGGQASVLAGTQCARPNAASPEAQTWPAGRYVPSHASCSAFHPQGLRDSTRAQLRLPGHTAVLVGCHGALGQPGRSGCSGAVAVLVSQSQQAAERRMPGNRCSLLSAPRNVALGATAGGFCAHACGQVHAIRLGERALGLVVRSGMMPGSMWATQHGSEDGSIPSVWWHPLGRDP